MDVRMPIARPRFQNADAGGSIFTQPVREHAARRTRAHYHIIERFHRFFFRAAKRDGFD